MHRLNPYFEKKPDFSDRLQRWEDWDLDVDFRDDRLCPTLANRLDYLYHILDLEPYLPFASSSRPLRVLDIGTGASAIYPVLLHRLRPDAEIQATELDDVSYHHSLEVLSKNDIPSSSITIRKSPSSDRILFPILDNEKEWDLTMCNPPFFGSEEEMREGQEGKELAAHAAPTAAANELITPGGEVAFVSKMIEESMTIGTRCCWYTSLIGKFSSLQLLIDLLKQHNIDNYMLKNVRQAKTTRWILGWSHSPLRVPDTIARPAEVIPNTSFARLLPAPNTLTHTPQPALSMDELHAAVLPVLSGIALDPSTPSDSASKCDGDGQEEMTLHIAPMSNTWSRAARRQAARQGEGEDSSAVKDGGEAMDSSTSQQGDVAYSERTPLFRAEIRFTPSPRSREGTILSLSLVEGTERTQFEALWKYLLSKAGLVGPKGGQDGGYGARLGGGVEWRARGRARARGGGRGSGRGHERDRDVRRDRGYVRKADREVDEEEYIARSGQRRRLM